MKDLVVYYSRTGKTETAARAIAGRLGADTRKLQETVGRKGPWGFFAAGAQAVMGVHSTLVNPDYSLQGYDRVALCQPLWASYPVPAMNAFLAHIDPRGKQFLLVAVRGGASAAKLFAAVRGSLESRGGKVVSTLEVRGGMGRSAALEAAMLADVEAWVATLAR
jgi:flavodoxin